ncbi:MAG: PqqD family protein [Anaerolineae bacterium]|nr:PqqD family protein [Anaerolineae bacterium]
MSAVTMDNRWKRSSSVVERAIARETVLIPINQDASQMDSIYTLSGVGAYIWSLLDGEKTLTEIHDMVVEEYEVDPQEAEADLVEFVTHLSTIGAAEAA